MYIAVLNKIFESGSKLIFLRLSSPCKFINKKSNHEKQITIENRHHHYYRNPLREAELSRLYRGYSIDEANEIFLFKQVKLVDINGITFVRDTCSKYYNVVNHHRCTTDTPEKFSKTIYFLGNCWALGIFSEDKMTIESQLQRKLNSEIPFTWRVLNYSNWKHEDTMLRGMLEYSDCFKKDDLIIVISHSDFDLRDIGKGKTAIFIVIQDEKTTYHSLATIFIKQCYETLIDVAQANGGKLPYRTNFILDEFANMPPLKDVTTMVTAARSRAIRFTFIIQNFAQLKSVYGNEDAETIKGNCGNMVYLISTELSALEEISKMCGEVKSSDKDKTASTPLVTVTDLQKLKLFEAIIIRWRMAPFKTKYTPNFKMDWGHPHIEAEFPSREKEPVQTFDLKTFVKEKKRKNMLESADSNGGSGPSPFGVGSPFGGGFGESSGSPFASPSSDGGLFGGMGGSLDLDQMMKDIDKKIAELDAEEARQKQEMEKKKKEDESKKIDVEADLPKLDDNIKITIDEPKIKDVEPEVTVKVETKEPEETKTIETEYNIFGSPSVTEEKVNTNIDSSEISIGNEKANIAVATSSPVDENEDVFDDLPKVEDASIIQPKYTSETVVKPNESKDYNIYNSIPNFMDEVKEEVNESTDDIARISKDELKNVTNKLDEYNEAKAVPETKVEVTVKTSEPEKTNVNIDPDKVVIKNNVISDDEFFDDFFGDD